MLNIGFGEKIKEGCILEKCQMYKAIVTLSNNSGLKGRVKCPELFCERFKKAFHICVKCKNKVRIGDGYFDGDNFSCYECPIEKEIPIEEVKKEIKEEPTGNQNMEEKFKEIENLLVKLSKNEKFMKNYRNDKNEKDYEFFNPMNSVVTPLVWPKKYFNETNIKKLKEEILSFFKTYLDMFKEEGCTPCEYEQTFFQSMSCIDCVRNKESLSMIKRDRFVEKKER